MQKERKKNEKILIIATSALNYSFLKEGTTIVLNRFISFWEKDSFLIIVPKSSIKKELFSQFLSRGNYYYQSGVGNVSGNQLSKKVFLFFNIFFINQIIQIVSIFIQTKKAIKQNKVKKIFVISYGPTLLVAYILHKRYGIPYVIHIFDLWRDNSLPLFEKVIANFLEAKIFKNAEKVITAGEALNHFLHQKYNINPITINNSTFISDTDHIAYKKDNNKKIILYTGSIYWAQADVILALIKAISGEDNIELHIYSFQKKEELLKRGIKGRNVSIFSWIPEKNLKDLYKNADILFLPLTFSKKSIPIIKTAQPGKTIDYLLSGVPILICAPSYSFVSDYCKKNRFGFVVNEIEVEKIKKTINLILENKNNIANKAVANAFKTAREFHDVEKNSFKLEKILFS